MERIEVAAGVVTDKQGRFLICRRTGRLAGLWEFPGGKREKGESYQRCLERELREELSLTVQAGEILWETEEQTADRVVHIAFVAAVAVDLDEMRLTVHDQAVFLTSEEWTEYAFCPADAKFAERIGNREVWG